MKMRDRRVLAGGILLAAALLVGGAQVQGQAPAPVAAAGKCHVLIVSGAPMSPVYARRFQDWMKRFHAYFRAQGVPSENITVLSGDKTFNDPIRTDEARQKSIGETLGRLSQKVQEQDQFVLVMLGHGSFSNETPAFVLPGPDMNAEILAKALSSIRAENQVVLNFAGASGDFLKKLSRRNRVNISATADEENAEPVLAEFFLRGLESKRADGEGGTKDGTVTVLEAYNWAEHQAALWICRQVHDKDGNMWHLDGKESVEIFKKLFDGPEGEVTPGGTRADGSRKLSPDCDANKPDEVVPLVVPSDIKPNEAGYWAGRRIVNEHGQLEDCGKESGIGALRGEKGYEAVTGAKPGEQGHLAARTVLGKAELLGGKETR